MSVDAIEKTAPVECLLAYNAHGGYAVPVSSSSRQCSRHVLNGRAFEPRMMGFVAEQVGTGDIVHAGTFFGDFLPAFSRALAPGAKIWAYEPVAENYACARITIELNRLDNVELAFAGLGEKSSEGVMVTTDADGIALGEVAYVSTRPEDRTGDTETIRIVSIDETVPADRNVTILQLDVEGYEEQALSGAIRTIRRCKPIILLETVPHAWVGKNLTPLGYRVRGGVHANVVLATRPVGGAKERLRWAARSLLKTIIPHRIRRGMRDMQAAQKETHRPTAADSGAVDCRFERQDGRLICAPSASASAEDSARCEAITRLLNGQG